MENKIVITGQEVAQVRETLQGGGVLPVALKPVISWWLKGLLFWLVLFLPAACVGALFAKILVRRSTPRVREAWYRYFLSLNIISGMLATILVVLVLFIPTAGFDAKTPVNGLTSLDSRKIFPNLPLDKEVSPSELAKSLSGMVFVVVPFQPSRRWLRDAPPVSLGAGVLIAAEPGGYLIATARHVIDGEKWKTNPPKPSYTIHIASEDGDFANADLIARHKELDIALLWVKRGTNQISFRQSVQKYESINVGDLVFAFGHPEGLFFSFTSGLVSGKREGRQIQISAPISPGSSGGPLYDNRGRLLGIASGTVDKNQEPNAENLNFAAPVEDLLNVKSWNFIREADKPLLEFLGQPKNSPAREAVSVPPPSTQKTNQP